MAQLVAHKTSNLEVAGSIPAEGVNMLTAYGTDISFINDENWIVVTANCNNEPYNCSACYINHVKVFATNPYGGIVFQHTE